MTRYGWLALMAFWFGVGGLIVPADAADTGGIQVAMAALEQAPTDAGRFQALVQAAVGAEATPEQARALAVCCLGFHLSGQPANAEKARALLAKNHGTAYQDDVSHERLFDKHVCLDCNGAGTLSVACPNCAEGRCPNCDGAGDRPGLTSRITCTVCRGTGRCKTCNGTGELNRTCPACRGTGGALEFKRDAVKEAYLSLLREGAAGADMAGDAVQSLPDGRRVIVLDAAQVERFNRAYNEATSLKKPGVYEAFLKQVGADEKGRTPPFLPVQNGSRFVVQDVGSFIRADTKFYYARLREDDGKRHCRLMLGTDRGFAERLQKGDTLRSSDWLAPLTGRPPWDVALGGYRDFYRSAAEYLSMQ